MPLPPVEIVPDDVMRRERPVSLNRLCNIRDWEIGNGLSLIMKELNENIGIHRKMWEYAICIEGCTKLGCVTPEARALAVGAGYERPLYYFANRIELMVATDLYENSHDEGKPEMLTTPELFAPFEYRRENLKVLQMNGDDLRFSDNEFDFVFCLSSIEHFGSREIIKKSLGEMIRVVRPNGIICIITELILNGMSHYEYFKPEEISSIFLSFPNAELVGGDFDLRIQKSLMEYPVNLSEPGNTGISPHIILDANGVIFTSLSIFLRKISSLERIPAEGLDPPAGTQSETMEPSYHFTANDARLHTAVGIREDNVIRVTEAQSGTILYGPYISLPAGGYEAVIHFDPDVPCRGTAIMDVCSDIGTNILAQKIIAAEDILGGDMSAKLGFSCQNGLSMLEIRLFCHGKFAGAVRSVDILEAISCDYIQENIAKSSAAQPLSKRKIYDPRHDFPALSTKCLQDTKLFVNRKDMISSMSFLEGGVVAEVGVAHGEFSEFLLSELNPSKFIAIDIFTMHEDPVAWGVPTAVLFDGMSHLDFYKHKFAGYGSRIVIEVGPSHQALAKYPDKSFDLIYVDAAHDYENVKRDAELSAQKLKDGGIIVFNDYIMYDHILGAPYGVVQAVNELVVSQGWQVWGFALQQHMFCDIAIRWPNCSS